MKAIIRSDVVHAGCGGQIRERYQDYEAELTWWNNSFSEGLVTYEQFTKQLDRIAYLEGVAAGKPDKERDLECLYCGEETAEYGTEDTPMRSYPRTVSADAYHGRIINPRD